MHRIYTVEQYLEKVAMLRAIVPNVFLGTDIIVGFPTETEEEFMQTYNLLKEIEYSLGFLFAYSPRKGTPAMRWKDDVPEEVKEDRLQRLISLQDSIVAKQRQEFVKARLRQLGKRMADLALINMDNIPKDRVGLGSTVRVFDNSKNAEVEYKLVTSEETDVAAGKISTSSPIGRALLNKKVGDSAMVVTPNGNREMDVLSLKTIHDEAPAS